MITLPGSLKQASVACRPRSKRLRRQNVATVNQVNLVGQTQESAFDIKWISKTYASTRDWHCEDSLRLLSSPPDGTNARVVFVEVISGTLKLSPAERHFG